MMDPQVIEAVNRLAQLLNTQGGLAPQRDPQDAWQKATRIGSSKGTFGEELMTDLPTPLEQQDPFWLARQILGLLQPMGRRAAVVRFRPKSPPLRVTSPLITEQWSIQWRPIPRKPWGVMAQDGKLIRGFDTAEAAQAFVNKASSKRLPPPPSPSSSEDDR